MAKKHVHELARIFSAVNDVLDMVELLEDACTQKEIEAIHQRFLVAQMLKDGYTFVEIENKTGMSSTTIARVNKCLKNGTGYNKLFDKYQVKIDVS
ncbi:MAG TPA: YerC/YecD family TrpR-related protein [Haloplasmataceae bacterium]